MTEFSTGEGPYQSKIDEAAQDPYLLAAMRDLHFGLSRNPRYDASEVLKTIMDRYSLTDKEARRAMDVCEHDLLTGIIGMPEGNKDEFDQIIAGSFQSDEIQVLSAEFAGPAMISASSDERIRSLAGDIAYGRFNKLENLTEINAALNEVRQEYRLSYPQISRVLNDVLAEYDEEIASETKVGQFDETAENAHIDGEFDEQT